MNGPIAQIVALACHANAALRDHPSAGFFPNNSTCRFCDRVAFVNLRTGLLSRKPKEILVASTPEEWFGMLREQHHIQVLLEYAPSGDRLDDRMSAGFVGGGGVWSLVAVSGHGAGRWLARWDVWNQDAPERRIWRVTYGHVEAGSTPKQPRSSMGAATAELNQALLEIAPFARRIDCEGFANAFDHARELLSPGSEADVYHRDLAPAGLLSDDAERLLAAAQKAWVFGGMGSWNDMMFDAEQQEEYERLSGALFSSLTVAIVTAANASAVADG